MVKQDYNTHINMQYTRENEIQVLELGIRPNPRYTVFSLNNETMNLVEENFRFSYQTTFDEAIKKIDNILKGGIMSETFSPRAAIAASLALCDKSKFPFITVFVIDTDKCCYMPSGIFDTFAEAKDYVINHVDDDDYSWHIVQANSQTDFTIYALYCENCDKPLFSEDITICDASLKVACVHCGGAL